MPTPRQWYLSGAAPPFAQAFAAAAQTLSACAASARPFPSEAWWEEFLAILATEPYGPLVAQGLERAMEGVGPNPTSLLPGAISLAEMMLRPFW
jgi:hypothetical protein